MMKFYLDGMLLPVTPGALATRITNQNKTVSLLNGEEYTFLLAAKRQRVAPAD